MALKKMERRGTINPKETKTISIYVNKKDLAWYNPEKGAWEVENIDYTLYIGSSSRTSDLITTQISLSL